MSIESKSNETVEEICSNCRHYREGTPDMRTEGSCHRYPPINMGLRVASFPGVDHNVHCGEFEVR